MKTFSQLNIGDVVYRLVRTTSGLAMKTYTVTDMHVAYDGSMDWIRFRLTREGDENVHVALMSHVECCLEYATNIKPLFIQIGYFNKTIRYFCRLRKGMLNLNI